MSDLSPLSGVKRKSDLRAVRAAFDPFETLAAPRDYASVAVSAPIKILVCAAKGAAMQRPTQIDARRVRELSPPCWNDTMFLKWNI
jgi:hypothetical protein